MFSACTLHMFHRCTARVEAMSHRCFRDDIVCSELEFAFEPPDGMGNWRRWTASLTNRRPANQRGAQGDLRMQEPSLPGGRTSSQDAVLRAADVTDQAKLTHASDKFRTVVSVRILELGSSTRVLPDEVGKLQVYLLLKQT